MQACLHEFNKKDAEKTSIARNGGELLSQFYESTTELSLNLLRYRIFHKKVTVTAVTPETLLPTSNAVMFHSYRSFFKTQVWMGESIDPPCWGFSIQKDKMMPVTMTEPPAPPNLLKIACSSFKTGCKTMTYSCRKHGLKCTDSCKECRGVS